MQFSDEIIKILEYLCQKLGITIDWTNKNIYPYLQQLCNKYIKWEISASFAWIAIMIVFIVLSIVGIIFLNDETVFIIGTFVILTAMIVIGVQIFDIIECYTFPEKAIYEYVQTYINSK